MGDTMDVNRIIEEFEEILRESEARPWGNSEILYSNAVDALRQQRAEIERLQGHLAVEARIRLELVEEARKLGMQQERALWELSAMTQEMEK
jgi:ElaB/YqjD/DUF883 family membrane-anchored ribosome-binding protein